MSEKCFRCGKLLPESYTMTMGDPQGSPADDIGWHWINAAPHAASGGTMVPVCNKCDPPPVFIPRAQHEALMAAVEALADIIDRGTITLIAHTHTNEDVIQALSQGAKELTALRAAGIDPSEDKT